MLAGTAMARPAPCVAQIAAATAAHASGLRDEITTFAPASAMRSAIALPMPRVEPVITAVLPASENNDMAGSFAFQCDTGALSCPRYRPLNHRRGFPARSGPLPERGGAAATTHRWDLQS